MTHIRYWIAAPVMAALVLATAPCLAADAPEPSVWQKHHEAFTFVGLTTHYSCDGLEGKVAQILRYFGARKDMQVTADGCPRGPDSLSRTIWVNADFYTLGSAAADAPEGSVVSALWTPFQMTGQRPFFMSEGDCELIQGMRPLLTHDFALRNLSIDVSCTPYQLTINDFSLKGEVLKSSAPHAG
jgi:hypothetical protein